MRRTYLMDRCNQKPLYWGCHPAFKKEMRQRRRTLFELEIELKLSDLVNPLHPEVGIISREHLYHVVDEWGDSAFDRVTDLPFSSSMFCLTYPEAQERESLFHTMTQDNAFWRLTGVSQLGYLVPPRPKELVKGMKDDDSILYMVPAFPHTRWHHSVLTALMAEVILARNGFTRGERNPIVLAFGSHDIAMPAGGDTVKRVDPKELDEEASFSWLLSYHGLDKKWAERFGFDLEEAQKWVRNEGRFGHLLDLLDKMAYTAVDCFHLGWDYDGAVRNFCIRHPLVMDVWEDIRLDPDNGFVFTDPERLYLFVLLRALEYHELLYNPHCRPLDRFLEKLVKPLYEKGIITKEQLLTKNDEWLRDVLSEFYPDTIKGYIDPQSLCWRKCESLEELDMVCGGLGDRMDHTEYIKKLKTGLDWQVVCDGKVVPLRNAISPRKVKRLEKMAESMIGYYVYYRA